MNILTCPEDMLEAWLHSAMLDALLSTVKQLDPNCFITWPAGTDMAKPMWVIMAAWNDDAQHPEQSGWLIEVHHRLLRSACRQMIRESRGLYRLGITEEH